MGRTTTQRRRLQICSSNVMAKRPELIKALQEKGYTVEIESCLDQCTRCESCAFALVYGRFRFAANPEAFLAKLP